MNYLGFFLLASLTVTAGIFVVGGLGTLHLGRLTDTPLRNDDGPRVSIVLAARDEALHLSKTIESLLSQTYEPLEIVVINDRSRDATGSIADAAASRDARVRVVHVEELPAGWLGKNHALHVGARHAQGEFLLFTDADVRLHPAAVAHAVAFMNAGALDHLSVLPTITSPSPAVRWSIGAFAIFFLLYTRAWQVPDQTREAAIGIGAFNLVRTGIYRAIGGHERIALRPDDDLQLGRLLKRHGASAGVLVSARTVNVDWYPALAELVRGVEKNAYAGLNYKLWAAAFSVASLILHGAYFLLPLLLIGRSRALAGVELVLVVAAAGVAARTVGQSPATALLHPVAALFFAWVQARAVLLTVWRGGIEWRGTFYPLADLTREPHDG